MIKTNSQLGRAATRLVEIRNQVEELRGVYSSADLDLRILPLLDEIEELTEEIAEYRLLKELPLEEIVEGPLSTPTLLDNVGQFLAKLRVGAGLTQGQVAELLGWRQSNVARFESESYTSHTVPKVLDFASALGVYLHVIPSMNEFLDPATHISPRMQEHMASSYLTVAGWIASKEEGWMVKEPLLGLPHETSTDAPVMIQLSDWSSEQQARIYFYGIEPDEEFENTARSVAGALNTAELTPA